MKTGLIFEPGNVDELASAIKHLLNNAGLKKEMGHNAGEFIKNEMNSEKHYERLMKIYNKACSSVQR